MKENSAKKILETVANILIIIILLACMLFAFLAISAKSGGGVSNIFGYTAYSVQSRSMYPVFDEGDLIIGKKLDDDTVLKVGDIVTFRATIQGENVLNTHRIISIEGEGEGAYYTTKGENPGITEADERKILKGDMISVYTDTKLAGVGTAIDFMQTGTGFFVCILLPVLLFFLFQLYKFIRNLIAYNKAKAIEIAESKVEELTEEQKRAAVEEYLASLKSREQQDGAEAVQDSGEKNDAAQGGEDEAEQNTDKEDRDA